MQSFGVLITLVGISASQQLWSPNFQNSVSSPSVSSRTEQSGRQWQHGQRISWQSQNAQQSLTPSQEFSQMMNPRWTGPVVFPAGHEGVYHYRPVPQVTESVQELDGHRSRALVPGVPRDWAFTSLPGSESLPYVSQHDGQPLQQNAAMRNKHLTAYIQVASRGHY